MPKEQFQLDSSYWLMIFLDRAELSSPGEITRMDGLSLAPALIAEIESLTRQLNLDITVCLVDGGVTIKKTKSK